MLAQADLLDRTAALQCDPFGTGDAPRLLSNGALAGVVCASPIEGASELKLFTYPDTWRLRRSHRARVDQVGERLRPDPGACVAGRPGVRKWDHGRVACWIPGGGSKAVLHWTDERTDTYGILRADVDADRRIDRLWQGVLEMITEAPSNTTSTPVPAES